MYAGHRQDLAHRRGDGIDVILWWSPEDNSVAVEVMHLATDSSFELVVDRAAPSTPSITPSPMQRAGAPNCWTSPRKSHHR